MKLKSVRICALVLVLLLSLGTSALADKVITNATVDCFDFFPATITFTDEEVIVEGYFFNYNLDRTISNINELELSIYDSAGKLVCDAVFSQLSDTLKNMRLIPGLSSLQSFTFSDTVRNPDNFDFSSGFSVSIYCTLSHEPY